MSGMSTAEFLGMVDHGDGQWAVPITDRAVGGGRGSLFGGIGLAVGVAAMEIETGQPAVWATAQYIATMYNPSEMRLNVTKPAVGRTVTQCRVYGTFEGDDVVTVLGATGQRPEQLRGVWEQYPDPVGAIRVGRSRARVRLPVAARPRRGQDGSRHVRLLWRRGADR